MKARHNRHFIKRRSVALISAAIFCATAAHAELEVGRLPSTMVTGGQVIGVKPNVFIVFDNSDTMRDPIDDDTKISYAQSTAYGLVTGLKQLEGIVRLGYTATKNNIYGADENNKDKACSPYTLRHNLNKLTANQKADLINAFPGIQDDSPYGIYGSGWGQLAPRDFTPQNAKEFYQWLVSVCPGNSDYDRGFSALPDEYPKNQQQFSNLFLPKSNQAKPYIDAHLRVIEIIASNKVVYDGNFKSGSTYYNLPFMKENNVKVKNNKNDNVLRRVILENGKSRLYDAYAPVNPEDGYPKKEGALECRQNYEIIITNGAYRLNHYGYMAERSARNEMSLTSKMPLPRTNLTNSFFEDDPDKDNYYPKEYDPVDPAFPYYGFSVKKNGKDFRLYRRKDRNSYAYIYNNLAKKKFKYNGYFYSWEDFFKSFRQRWKHMLPQHKNSGTLDFFSDYVFDSYYTDLREDLPNMVPEFLDVKTPRNGIDGNKIPLFWDRKNDVASWQHLTVFTLGFPSTFLSWKKAMSFFPANNSTEALEGYFKAIETGDIVKKNFPEYSWGRKGYGTSTVDQYYFMPNDDRKIRFDAIGLNEMDFAKAGGIMGRGGAYAVDDANSIKVIIKKIANRIEKAMAQEVSGAGAVSGGGRVTAVQQMGGNSSALFTSYIDEETVSGNLFAYRNCPLIKEKIKNEAGNWVTNPEWIKGQCGQRLWNAATVLENGKNKIEDKTIFPKKKDGKLVGKTFSWSNIKEDSEAKNALQGGESEELAKARVDWINGKEDFSDANIAEELRKRPNILIPKEGQRYKIGPDGKPVQDAADGSYVMAEPENIPNRVGEIVYATAQTVDPVGTLGAAHKLNKGDYDSFKNKIKKRPPLVLVGANDGRLYGFTSPKDQYAKLAFSYIPRKVIVDGRLTATTKTSYSTATAKSLVNGPFRISDAQVDGQWGTYVVGTLGAGGSTAYALEITSKGDAQFKWEIDIDNGSAKIMAPPRIVWLKKDKSDKEGQWVVLLPSGYNAKDVSLIVLDLKDGKEIARIDTGAKYDINCKLQNSTSNPYKLEETIKLPKGGAALCVDNGLGDLTVTDADGDDAADYVYAGDLLGHVWKFDLTRLNLKGENEKIKVAYERPLFIAKDKQGMRQSITSMIEIDDGAYGEGSILYFGTGRLFNQQERNIDQRQSFYAVWENPRYFENLYVQLPLKRDESSSYAFMQYEPVTITDIASKLSDPESSLKEYKEIRVIKRIDSLETDKYLSYDRNGTNINSAAKAMGWVMDFPEESARERVIDRARTFDEAIFFSSFEPKASDLQESCGPPKGSVGGDGRFYMLDRLTGNTLETSAFDYNHDNKRDDQDKIRVDSSLLGGTLTGTGGGESTRLVSPASLMVSGSANFVQLEGVQERGAECDYTRQVIFPGTVNPETGNPETLLGCYHNRYRVWKQPVSGN